MLRNDGCYVVYIIQNKIGSKWANTNLHYFSAHSDEYFNCVSCGQCFDNSDISGTYDIEIAKTLKNQLQEKYEIETFRVAKVTIEQKTEIV